MVQGRLRQGKYRPLTDYLAALPGDAVTLRFTQLQDILDSPLPLSAWRAGWWSNRNERSNQSQAQSQAWRAAGWRVARVDIWAQTVMFERESGDGAEPLPPAPERL